MSTLNLIDVHEARVAQSASCSLRAFNEAGVLTAADVHVALRLGGLAQEEDEKTLLATALAVRAPRLGSVCVDLATIGVTAATDLDLPVDVHALPWPEPQAWIEGGNLARLAAPADVITLMLSDVVGSPLDVIASGPTVPDTSTFQDAWKVIQAHDLADELPKSIAERLQAGLGGGIEETPRRDPGIVPMSASGAVALLTCFRMSTGSSSNGPSSMI